MGSGLIYAMVVVVWVGYLIPTWLHRDEDGSRSVDRYRRAMRLVSRGTETPIVLSDEERRHSRAVMRRRRMVVLIALATTLLISTAFALLGVLAVWFPALPLLGLAVYVTHVRRVVIAERVAMSRALVARRASSARPQPRLSDPTVVQRSAPRMPTVMEPPSTTVRVRTEGAPVRGRTEDVSARDQESSRDPWSPVEVPLPTYVTAPKAVRAHRIIDLTKPGAWTEEQKQAEQAALAAIAPSRDEVFDQVAAEEALALVTRLADDERRAAGNP